MPAVSYDYNYYRTINRNQGLAQKTRSVSAYNKNSAQSKVKRHNHTDIDIPVVVKKKVELEKPKEMKLTKPKNKVKEKARTEMAKKIIFATLVGFGVLFVICTRYAQINELTHKLNTLEKDLVGAQSLNQQLSAEVDSKTDLNYIEKYAKYQLGMQKPDNKQIVRIAYDKQDKISTPINIDEESELTFWDKLFNDLRNIID